MQQYIREVYSSYPSLHREKLLLVRTLIFDIAKQTPVVGEIEETLKWGEPSYLTKNKSGSTIRLAWNKKKPDQCGIYFNCKTTLISSFRKKYKDFLHFEGNRAIIFKRDEPVSTQKISECIKNALTYHTNDKSLAD